jgi:4-hydroxybenzoate polyprenyltransferase/phosphoserine phosphatase
MVPQDVAVVAGAKGAQAARGPAGALPLAVDLDGTLIATDTLWESVLLLARKNPLALLLLPFWTAQGKAHLKSRLADHVLPNVAAFPYRPEVLAHVEQARAAGRPVLLLTASDQRVADAVRTHLGLFDEAIGSDGERNMRGEAKRRLLEERYGPRGFAYAGDSPADVPVWRGAGEAVLVGASPSLAASAGEAGAVTQIALTPRGRAGALVKALRPHQWVKNLLLFVAPILGYRLDSLGMVLQTVAAFFAFSLAASAGYVLNDLLDLESDRQHSTKKARPFAAARLTIPEGLLLAAACMAGSLVLSLATRPIFTLAVVGYFVATVTYSVYLKRKLIVDVVVLALLFTYRVLAGGLAVDVPVSFWLLAFSLFLFTGLAFAKRYSDLVRQLAEGKDRVHGRTYAAVDLPTILSVGSGCGLVAVMVFALYIHSPEVRLLYPRPEALWFVCPVLLYWFTRVWFLAARNELNDDPIVFAIKDRNSYLAGLVAAACLVAAKW